MSSGDFWDRAHGTTVVGAAKEDDRVLLAALHHFGNVAGKRVLDIGCGNGAASLFFASKGALVTSIDFSAVAIDKLQGFCKTKRD